jgi:hypothetical protein
VHLGLVRTHPWREALLRGGRKTKGKAKARKVSVKFIAAARAILREDGKDPS